MGAYEFDHRFRLIEIATGIQMIGRIVAVANTTIQLIARVVKVTRDIAMDMSDTLAAVMRIALEICSLLIGSDERKDPIFEMSPLRSDSSGFIIPNPKPTGTAKRIIQAIVLISNGSG